MENENTTIDKLKTLFEKTGSFNVKVYYSSFLEISDDVPFAVYGGTGVKQFTVTGHSHAKFNPMDVGQFIGKHGYVFNTYSGYSENVNKWNMVIRVDSVEYFMDEIEKVFKKMYDEKFYEEFENVSPTGR